MTLTDVSRTATFSEDRVYRYDLTREWGDGWSCLWVMLNPSTADHRQDDPTIRRVMRFSRDWGAGEAVVVNLFAYRATKPAEMLAARDPVGPLNDDFLHLRAATADRIVCAWGAAGKGVRDRAAIVRDLLRPYGTLWRLGKTLQGAPLHPLYVPAVRPVEPW